MKVFIMAVMFLLGMLMGFFVYQGMHNCGNHYEVTSAPNGVTIFTPRWSCK